MNEPELEIWIETNPCGLRPDCELAQLHYHVLDQIFYDLSEVRAVYPDELPVKQERDPEWQKVEAPFTMPVSLATPGVEWDGKRGHMVYGKNANGERVPLGLALTGTADPNMISVVVQGTAVTDGTITQLPGNYVPAVSPWGNQNSTPLAEVRAAAERALREGRSQGTIVLGPGHEITLSPIQNPEIEDGDTIEVTDLAKGIQTYKVQGGTIQLNMTQPEDMADEQLWRHRAMLTERLGMSVQTPDHRFGNIC